MSIGSEGALWRAGSDDYLKRGEQCSAFGFKGTRQCFKSDRVSCKKPVDEALRIKGDVGEQGAVENKLCSSILVELWGSGASYINAVQCCALNSRIQEDRQENY